MSSRAWRLAAAAVTAVSVQFETGRAQPYCHANSVGGVAHNVRCRLRNCLVIFAALSAALISSAHGTDVALVHARIYASPDAAPIVDGNVLIHDGRISAVGAGNVVKVPPG